jgi:hypothetical protein
VEAGITVFDFMLIGAIILTLDPILQLLPIFDFDFELVLKL